MFAKGEKIFVITRRLFEKDLRRHFVGEVQETSETAVRVRGYAFVFDESTNDFIRREELRTRVFSMVDAGIVINLLPGDIDMEQIRYGMDAKNRRVITDGKAFQMNVSEFALNR